MAKTQAHIQVRVDQDIKDQSEKILDRIGISMSDLINMTLRRVVFERRIPFDTAVADSAIPECMSIHTQEEALAFLEKGFVHNQEHSQSHTVEEAHQSLKTKYGLEL